MYDPAKGVFLKLRYFSGRNYLRETEKMAGHLNKNPYFNRFQLSIPKKVILKNPFCKT